MELYPDGRFVPLTFSIGLLESPFHTVIDAYLTWTKKIHPTVESHPINGGLSSGLAHLEPLSTPPRRSLLLSTESQWTAYFDNGSRGPDPFSTVSYLAQRLHCRGVIVHCIPHTMTADAETGTYGAVQFELFAPEPRQFLNYERAVSVAHDGDRQWRFDARGTVQPFEEVHQYTAPKIRDRFTPDMLERYCSALGIQIFDETFYRSPGLLVVVHYPLPKGARELTLIEAQRELGRTGPPVPEVKQRVPT